MVKLSTYALMLLLDAYMLTQNTNKVSGSLYQLYMDTLFNELVEAGCFTLMPDYSHIITDIGKQHVAKVINQTVDRI